ncbi:hypothetical protein [Mesorhizobium sophorae]|uniref:hypothetical protein n=1 Tax=Mesorhizobium sophorae TaxID=1300294 RepID=UPI000BA32E08|nr:hypothetical protein [Mesorhizobium sophorae]
MKRHLTDEEKARVCDRLTAIEGAKYPDHIVSVMVGNETDDNGDPVWSVVKSFDDREAVYGHSPLIKWPGCSW